MSARAVALHRPRAEPPRWRATALLCTWCALCILFAQTLGLVHGIAHGPIHGDAGTQAAPAVAAHPGHAQGNAQVAPDVLETLFAQHEDAEDCRLFDALGQQPGAAVQGAQKRRRGMGHGVSVFAFLVPGAVPGGGRYTAFHCSGGPAPHAPPTASVAPPVPSGGHRQTPPECVADCSDRWPFLFPPVFLLPYLSFAVTP